MKKRLIWAGAALLPATALAAPAWAASPAATAPAPNWLLLLAGSLAWLTPAGFLLLAAAGARESRVWQSALGGVAGIALGSTLFFLIGFALAFGGLGLVRPDTSGFEGLVWEWTLLAGQWGTQWGMAGMKGWALSGPAATVAAYELFFVHLPWVATATMIPLMAFRGRTPATSSLVGGVLIGGILYPLLANWIWGGGWLANLGANLTLGHGFVDFAGGGLVHVLGGGAALAGLLLMVPRPAAPQARAEVLLPPVQLPMLAALGALLVLVGSLGWAWANPLLDTPTLLPARGLINVVLAAAAGALAPLGYTWFVADRADPLLTGRGLAAGAVIAAAAGSFIPPWAALLLGLLAGGLVPLLTYLVCEILRVPDDTGVVPVHLAAGLLGLLGVGLFADGLAGSGWNGIGAAEFLGGRGAGVAGALAAAGLPADWPGQMQAQLIGMAAIVALGVLGGAGAFGLIALIARGLRLAQQQRRLALARAADHAEAQPAE
ncbi:MAG: hypothetical protein ABTQ73_12940 [Caldilineales bacterium]